MKRALILLMLLAGAPASAESVGVRSGEHADFSRLVIDFDAGDGWELGRVDGGWEFRAKKPGLTFDVGRVYDLIPRKRLATLTTPAPGVIRLGVDCACHVDAFELRRSRVVIDVKDGAAPKGNPFEKQLEAVVPNTLPAEEAKVVEPPPKTNPPEPARPLPPPADLASAIDAASRPSMPLPGSLPGRSIPEVRAEIDTADRTRAFEKEVLDQIARAASQGLVEAAELPKPAPTPGHEPEAAGDTPHGDAPNLVPPAESHAPMTPPEDEGHIRVETAIDRDSDSARPPAEGLTYYGRRCPSPALVDLPVWGRKSDGLPEIGIYRDALVGEFDKVDPARALELARFYVYLTFGAEARQTLRFVPPETPGWAEVDAMAQIEDAEGRAPVGTALDNFETCDSAIAMWSVLAGKPLARGDEVNEAAVLAAFKDLPSHAKALLGPKLVDMFRDADRIEAAAMLRNAMNLADEHAGADATLANVKLDEAMGQEDKAAETLHDALTHDDPDSPEMLLASAEAQIGRGEALEEDLVIALESVVYEQRGTEIAHQIERVLAGAAIVDGRYQEARQIIEDDMGPSEAPDLMRQLYDSAAGSDDDAGFLRLVLPVPAGLGTAAEDAPVRRKTADRLVRLGFGEDALNVLGDLARGNDAEARMIAARAYIQIGKPSQAVAALSPLTSPEAVSLTAEAQEAAGNLSAARTLYAEAGRPADAERIAVILGHWDELAAAEDPALRTLADRIATDAPPPPAGDDPYGVAQGLIDGSSEDRAAIEAVLAGN